MIQIFHCKSSTGQDVFTLQFRKATGDYPKRLTFGMGVDCCDFEPIVWRSPVLHMPALSYPIDFQWISNSLFFLDGPQRQFGS
jgi:hypothetical protein